MKKGKVLTVAELKSLPKDSFIHLFYLDDDGKIRTNEFKQLMEMNREDEFCTTDCYTIPIEYLKDDEILSNVENGGWLYTVREAIIDNEIKI